MLLYASDTVRAFRECPAAELERGQPPISSVMVTVIYRRGELSKSTIDRD
jgi:hypothetical protein